MDSTCRIYVGQGQVPCKVEKNPSQKESKLFCCIAIVYSNSGSVILM